VSYLVLARKFRPPEFASVHGQEQVVRTLKNSIKRGTVHHAYVFAGPRGVGKTSVARIFSKALNCVKGPTADPCLTCSNCREITEGRSFAVQEIDGASHNSVDNVRDLIDSLRTLPAPGYRYKVYIIDEVHMLSLAAFNALLKSLEEPPPNTVFILATTELHKIPDTVLSRCQRHDFRSLSPAVITKRLRELAEREKIAITDPALGMIARLADGSMRDSQSLLDRVQAFAEGEITPHEVAEALSAVGRTSLKRLADAIVQRSPDQALKILAEIFSGGIDPRLLLNEFVAYWRDLLVTGYGSPQELIAEGLTSEETDELKLLVAPLDKVDLFDLVSIAREGADQAMRSAHPRLMLESTVVRMAAREPIAELGKILGSLRSGVTSNTVSNTSSANTIPRNPAKQATPLRASQASSEAAPAAPAALPLTNKSVAPVVTATAVAATVALAPSPEWKAFVESVDAKGFKMMAQNLKRLAVEDFRNGKLKAKGPKVVLAYFQDAESKTKLQGLLKELVHANAWQMEFSASDDTGFAKGSLHELEQRAGAAKRVEVARNAEQHPAIETIKKVFPGSTLQKRGMNDSR
jgi:DNA polymerase-3 subunit gamma/tau